MSSIVIEFAGMPGSGKSTIARHLHPHFAQQSNDARFVCVGGEVGFVKRVLRKIWVNSSALLFQPKRTRYFLSLIVEVARSGQIGLRRAIGLYTNAQFIDSYRKDTCSRLVLDQGPAQMVWSLGYSAPQVPIDTLSRYLSESYQSAATRTNCIVIVECSEKVLQERLLQRMDGKSPLDNVGLPNLEQAFAAYELMLTAITKTEQANKVLVTRVNGEASPEHNANVILEKFAHAGTCSGAV